ncbi:MAG: hypothetical protein ACI4UV_05080, partial [Victivallales bacterium]
KLKTAAIEAQLNAVDASADKTEPEDPDYDDKDDKDNADTPVSVQAAAKPTATVPAASTSKADQPELDFGF